MGFISRGSQKWSFTWKSLLMVWLSFCIQLTAGQVSISPPVQDAPVGGTATLSVRTTVSVLAFNWYRGTVISDPNRILSYRPGPPFNHTSGPQHTGREKALPNGDLEITSLLTTDTGNYTLQIVRSDFTTQQATAQLRVYEPVTKPTVQYSSSELVENRGPAVITCDNSSAAETIFWYFNGKPFLPDNTRVTLTDKNRTLTIANVSRSDSGIYQCQAINPVSNKTSDPQTLTVAYGPQNVKIDPPGDQILPVGTKLTLTCTVASFPDPTYRWFLNNTDLNQTTRTLTVQSLSSRDEGNYTCVAQNTLTGLSPNATVYIAVNDGADSPNLSGGEIAGIVIGVLALCGIVGGLVYYFVFMKPATGPSNSIPMDPRATAQKSTDVPPNAKANGNAEEIQYSSVNFVPKVAPPAKPTNENTVYSEVRR